MPPAVAWLAAAAALLLWPRVRAGPTAVPGRRVRSPRVLSFVAAGAAAALGVALCGPAAGSVVAVIAGPLAVVIVRRLPRGGRDHGSAAALPLCLDLAAAALRAGQTPDAALTLAAPAAGTVLGADLLRVAGLLRLGAEPEDAWRIVRQRAELEPVAAAARRSADSGIRLAGAFEEAAAELRDRVRAAATARAERSGVAVVAPLALCFLPAFVCVGIVPAVVGIASAVLHGVL